MNNSSTGRIAAVVICGFLATACGGGGGSSQSDSICTVIGGGAAQVAATPAASFSNATAAFDGDLSSFGSLTTSSGTLRGTAQTGTMQTGGPYAGLAISTPAAGTLSVSITTFLNGTQQDTGAVGSQSFGSSNVQNCNPGQDCRVRNDLSYFGLRTTKNFDAIEAVLSYSGSASPLQIRELCIH